MLATLVVTLFTYDLAMGVLMGGLLSGFFFAHKFWRIIGVTSRADAAWVLSTPETSLYLSPFMISNERFLEVRTAKKVACF